jgi:hypothetical protein
MSARARAAWFAVALGAALLPCERADAQAVALPARVEGNVVVLTPALQSGRRLRILVDSGGYDLIDPPAAVRTGSVARPVALRGRSGRSAIAFPAFAPRIPLPPTRWLIARPSAFASTFAVPVDATLGASWMRRYAITVDYPRRTVSLAAAAPNAASVPLRVAIGVAPAPDLPPIVIATIDVRIAGEALTMLLDTGSTASIGVAARRAMPDRSAVRQACLIDAVTLERWHRAHPRWPYIASGAALPGDPPGSRSAMIRVPSVGIGALRSWPTWFVARADRSTFAALSKRLGRPVTGDLGGDALRSWKVTYDLAASRLRLSG